MIENGEVDTPSEGTRDLGNQIVSQPASATRTFAWNNSMEKAVEDNDAEKDQRMLSQLDVALANW